MFYRGTDEFAQIYWSAPEYQLLDNVNAADNKKDNHLAGSVYDLFASPKDAAKPANEWNQTRIVARGKHVEHWLNGRKVVSFERWTPEWNALKQAGKWKEAPDYGMAKTGRIAIQDHGSVFWFRNVKIRTLP